MELKVLPVIQVFISMLLMYLADKYINILNYESSISLMVSSIFLLLSIAIMCIAIDNFKSHQTTVNPTKPENASKVVNSGIYAYSRNPMYLAMLLLITSAALYLQNIASIFIIPIFIAYITQYQIKPEERALTLLFGKEYNSYQKQVRRWI